MSTTTTEIQPEQAFYTLKQFQSALRQKGVRLSARNIRHLISKGHIKAQKDVLRPLYWIVSHQELVRVVNQVS